MAPGPRVAAGYPKRTLIALLAVLCGCTAACRLIFPFSAVPAAADGGPAEGGLDAAGTGDAAGDAAGDAVADGRWWNSQWRWRKRITVTAVLPAPLTEFPLLINQVDADLKLGLASGPQEIVFTGADGTVLPHEIEQYDATAGRLVAWVSVPRVETGTAVYLYYGNPDAAVKQQPAQVWSAGYRAVWHFHQSPPQLVDSSPEGRDGLADGGMDAKQRVPGQVGPAYAFDGVDDLIKVPFPAGWPTVGSLTVSAWYRQDDTDTDHDQDEIVTTHGDDGARGWALGFSIDPSYQPCRALLMSVSVDDGSSVLSVGWHKSCGSDWHHAVGVYERGVARRLYVDGKEVDAQAANGELALGLSPLLIGAHRVASNGRFRGAIDELRISNVARSAAWIAVSYLNQSAPQSFYAIGSQQAAP